MNIQFTFFGSSRFSVIVLDELTKHGFIPAKIVTTPDKPQGRRLTMTPNVVKAWAMKHSIGAITPEKLDSSFIEELKVEQKDIKNAPQVFIVASYGKIIPAAVIDIPPRKTLNIHPSLLPQYRGASPLPTAILNDTKHTGITIMRINEKMDEGPIVAQKEISIESIFPEWPTYEVFEEYMAREGARLLASVLPDWIGEKIEEKEQDHLQASYTKKIKKEDGLIDLTADSYANFRKIQAYHEWPQAYFFIGSGDTQIRVKITSVSFRDGILIIEKVIPENSREMSYKDFASGYSDS